MTKPKKYLSSWRNSKVEQKFRVDDKARWDRATKNLPTAIDVATSFGSTRAHHWPGTGSTIVFLHGMGDTSIRWVQFAEALPEHNVYAIDTMGDPGNSIPEIGFESAADYGSWLGETLDGLGLDSPHIVGHSMGGYIALSYAVQGGAAESFVLFDPVGVVKLKVLRFFGWNLLVMAGVLSPDPVRHWAARRLRHPVMNDKADARLLLRSQRDHPPKPPPLPIFTDAQLASIEHPVRLVAGADTSAFNVRKMVQRITAQVTNGKGRLLATASHALVMSHFDECLTEVRAALVNDTSAYTA